VRSDRQADRNRDTDRGRARTRTRTRTKAVVHTVPTCSDINIIVTSLGDR